MTKKEFESLKEEIKDIKNINNDKLIQIMENISIEFDVTKNSILSLSMYLDSLEEMYNFVLKEYEDRTNVRK